MTTPSIEALEARVARIEGILEELRARLVSIENRLDRLEDRIARLVGRLEDRVSGLQTSLESRMQTQFQWMMGITLSMWVTVILAIFLLKLGTTEVGNDDADQRNGLRHTGQQG